MLFRSPLAGLDYTPEVAALTAPLYERVRHVVPEVEWPAIAPLVADILRLKREHDAVVLAHNYMTSDIFYCVGDFRGDSLQLAREAARTTARVIVQAGVHFMAETSKILSPDKTVLQEVAGGNDYVVVGGRGVRVETFLEQFLFPGAMKHARVGSLSGEIGRAHV